MHPQHLTLASKPERLHGHVSPDELECPCRRHHRSITARGSLPVAATTALIFASTRADHAGYPDARRTQQLLQSADPARCTSLNNQTACWWRWSAELKAWATASFQPRGRPAARLLHIFPHRTRRCAAPPNAWQFAQHIETGCGLHAAQALAHACTRTQSPAMRRCSRHYLR